MAEWPALDKEARELTARIQTQLSIDVDSGPLSSIHIDKVLYGEQSEQQRTPMDASDSRSAVDRESVAEL